MMDDYIKNNFNSYWSTFPIELRRYIKLFNNHLSEPNRYFLVGYIAGVGDARLLSSAEKAFVQEVVKTLTDSPELQQLVTEAS